MIFDYEFGQHNGIVSMCSVQVQNGQSKCGTSTTKIGIGHLNNRTSPSKCKFRQPHPETENKEK
jgi:hypothetical protein